MSELRVSGSHGDIGRQCGRQLKYAIQMSIEHWVMGHTVQYKLKDAIAYGRRMAADMTRRWPAIMEEVEGLAEGAAIPLDIMQANVFRCWNALSKTHPATLACYNMACRDPRRGPILAGVLEDSPPYYLTEIIHPRDGIPFCMVTWAGMPYAIRSMNKAGLTIGQASAFAGTRFRPGQNDFSFALYARCFFAERKAIQHATTVAEAIAIIRSFDCASTLMIGDRTGKIVTLEVCGKLHAIRRPDRDGIMTGGLFESPELVRALLDEGIAHDWEAGVRMARRVSTILRAAKGRTTVEWMIRYLKRESADGGWCHDGCQAATVASPKTGEFWVSGYRPCVSPFRKYNMFEL